MKNIPKYVVLFVFFLFYSINYSYAKGEVEKNHDSSAALFLVNNAGPEYDSFLPSIKDNIISLLTQKGMQVLRPENAFLPKGLPDSNENKTIDPQQEASLNRLAENINAKLMILATINSVTHDVNSFDGTGTIIKANVATALDTVRINLQVYDLGSTKSVYGDSVSSSIRTPILGQSQSDTNLINLFHEASLKLAENITNHVNKINLSATQVANNVNFNLSTNVESVDVFIDGVVIGSSGLKTKFSATPGIHQLKLGKEFLKSWEKTVNIVDGAEYNVQLELSADGLQRYKDIQSFNIAMKAANASIEMAKEQSSADAKAKLEISKGERVKRENSYIHDDGFVDNLKKLTTGE